MTSRFKEYTIEHPYLTIFISAMTLFFLSMVRGIGLTFVGDYAVYVAISQNLFNGGILYQTAIDTKNTGFFFIFYHLIYFPYASFFATTEYLHIWQAIVTLFWYFGLSSLIYNILKPFYNQKLSLFSALAFQLFNLGNRHSLFFNQPQATLMIVLILTLFLVHTYKSQKLWHHFIYGLLLAWCFLTASPYFILVLLIPIIAFYLYQQEKHLGLFILRGIFAFSGFLLGMIPFFTYFISRNALSDWWFWNFFYPKNIYLQHPDLYILSGLQLAPFLALPFLSKAKNITKKSLLLYFSCFLIPAILLLIVLPSVSSFDYVGIEQAKQSPNILLRLFAGPTIIPIPNILAKPLTVLLSFFTGVDYLIFHTPTSLYHHYLVVVIFCASIFTLSKKYFPPFPILTIGILSLCARFFIARGAGGDAYNMYTLWILWLPFIISVASSNFAKIQKAVFTTSYIIAVIYLLIINIYPIERVNQYSPQVKTIVNANPDKKPTVFLFPWSYSYSTQWDVSYYNMYQDYKSTYEEMLISQQPETLLMINSIQVLHEQARYIPILTNYQKVTDDLYSLYIRKDVLPSWNIPNK